MSDLGFTSDSQQSPRASGIQGPVPALGLQPPLPTLTLMTVPGRLAEGAGLRRQAPRPDSPEGPTVGSAVVKELRRSRGAAPLPEGMAERTGLHPGAGTTDRFGRSDNDATAAVRRERSNDDRGLRRSDAGAAVDPSSPSRVVASGGGLPDGSGLPEPLRAGLEELSGLDLSDVRVRYNSPGPAARHALAYTSGSDIEVGPGQEKHLAHEGWHVVQQKLGRVKPSVLLKRAPVNTDPLLEREADVMGARAAALARTHTRDQSPDRVPDRRRVFARAPAMQLKGEKEFNKDPSAFMQANQVLVAFDEGVKATYQLSPEIKKRIEERAKVRAKAELEKVDKLKKDQKNGVPLQDDKYTSGNQGNSLEHVEKDRYNTLIEKSTLAAESATLPETLRGKGNEFLIRLMKDVMSQGECEWFTLAARVVDVPWHGYGGRTQYIVTPALEMMAMNIAKTVMTELPDGTPIGLQEALFGLKREPPDAYIRAAYIPYESDPNKVTAETSVDVPIDGEIKVAFTAAMNGCSLAISKTSPTELRVWHFPSPDSGSGPERWKALKDENNVTATYDWRDYNDLSDDERNKQHRNHATTTVLIRDAQGWKIKSQQNVGPEGGRQNTDLLKVGTIFEERLKIGDQANVDFVNGKARAHTK